MKTVILAGGFGSRLSEETHVKPKPMIEIGGKPVLWHILKMYSHYGINDFIICCGYKGYLIKEYFANYFLYHSDCRFDLKNNKIEILKNGVDHWNVTLIDTGENTMTGGRLKRVKEQIGDGTFCLTYGDGVCDVNIQHLIEFHREQKVLATLTAAQPPGRFGTMTLRSAQTHVEHFAEKPVGDGAWINGGFFVLEPAVIDLIDGDETVWEREPLERLVSLNALAAYKHRGFWQSMDTLRDKMLLESLWAAGNPPWKVWE